MQITTTLRGQSLIEILFAIAIFTIGVITIGFLIFDSFASLRYNAEAFQARLLAAEGIEAVYALNDSGFDTVTPGVYGLVLEGGVWTLGSTSRDTVGKFRREITIDVIDDATRSVLSEVFYDAQGREKSVLLSTILSNWRQNYGMGKQLSVDPRAAMLTASSTELSNIEFQADEDVTITTVMLQFEGETSIEEVIFGEASVFTASTSAAVVSGEQIDIDDYLVQVVQGTVPMRIRFSAGAIATRFVLTFYFSDGTVIHTPIFI